MTLSEYLKVDDCKVRLSHSDTVLYHDGVEWVIRIGKGKAKRECYRGVDEEEAVRHLYLQRFQENPPDFTAFAETRSDSS